MKKYLFFFALAALAFASCKKTDVEGDGGPARDLEATLTITNDLSNVVFAEPVDIAGTAESSEAIDGCTLVSVKKSGDTYTEVGESQTGNVDGKNITAQFFVDSKEITDIKVTLTAGNAARSFYFPVGKVTGELKGHVYINVTAQFMADNKVATHENDPETYPEANTGAGSDTKSFFSMHGVEIDGQLEHILSLNQLRAVDGKNGSFCFLNVLENTAKTTPTYIGSQRGYMFSNLKASQLGGGTTGRQCDIYEVNGHGIKDANVDINFTMKYVRGSWAGEDYHADIYTFVDKLFLEIQAADTPLKEMKAFWQLSQIQKTLDNATLGEEDEPTSLGGQNYVRKWVNAGDKATSALEEVFRAGDYIIIRSQRGTVEEPVYYYGIMQVLNIYDDSKAFVNGRLDVEKTYDLFMKPMYLSIKTQFEVPAE